MTQNYLQQSDFIAQKAYKTKNCLETMTSSLIPSLDRTYNIGSAQRAINEIHAKKVYVDSNSLVVGTAVLSALGDKLSKGKGTLINGNDVESMLSDYKTFLDSGNAGEVFVSKGNKDTAWNSQFCRATTPSVLQSGLITTSSVTGTFNFVTPFNAIPIVTITLYGSANNYGWLESVTDTSFTWRLNTAIPNLPISWIAIAATTL
jgi:hypothetical protein